MRYYNLKKFNSTRQYLKAQLKQWKQDSLKKNPKCQITNQVRNVEIHHLNRSFNQIFDETFQQANLPYYPSTTQYTQEQLIKLSNIILALHYKYGYGIAMAIKLHRQFHKEFGDSPSKEDYYTFKKRYKYTTTNFNTSRPIN